MKILGILTAYFPQLDELQRNIQSFLPEIDHLIIWENTPGEKSYIQSLYDSLPSDKIEIRTTGENEYLAQPFNVCAKWAVKNGYTHLLTMDQDSYFAEGHFARYIQLIANFTDSEIAVYGPNSNSREFVAQTGEVDYVFISGAIFPLKTLIEAGGFNEKLAIDAIDTEYCLKAKQRGFKTIVIAEVYLQHQLGYRQKHWTGLTLVPYSAQRTYYYIRNTLWLWKQFPDYFDQHSRKIFIQYRIIYRALKLIFEQDSFRKLAALITALWHSTTNHLGRYDKFRN